MLGYVLVVLYSDGKLIGNLSKIVPKSNQGNKKLILTFFCYLLNLWSAKKRRQDAIILEKVSFAVHEQFSSEMRNLWHSELESEKWSHKNFLRAERPVPSFKKYLEIWEERELTGTLVGVLKERKLWTFFSSF